MRFLTKINCNTPSLDNLDNLETMVNECFGPFLGSSWIPWDISPLKQKLDVKSTFQKITGNNRNPIRLSKSGDTTTIEFDVPGLDKENIDIQYDNETSFITVSSKQKSTEDSIPNKVITEHTFNYRVLVDSIDSDTFEAVCDKGILTITGKSVQNKPNKKQIKIR